MREIDSSQERSDARLSRALRSLSAASPTDAPPEIGGALAGAFRRHHARRWAVRRVAVLAAAFAIVLPATLLLVRKPPQKSGPRLPEITAASVPTASISADAPGATPGVSVSQPHGKRISAPAARKPEAEAADNDFVALPSYDQAAPGEDLRVIRVQLTGQALRMVGAPVNEEIADRRFLADFVVGQDGTPYAVRLVR